MAGTAGRAGPAAPDRGGGADHAHSQPKIIHKTKQQSQMQRSPKRDSSNKSRSKRSVRLPNGNIICAKCVKAHPDLVPKRQRKMERQVT